MTRVAASDRALEPEVAAAFDAYPPPQAALKPCVALALTDHRAKG